LADETITRIDHVDLWIPITIGAAFFQNLRSAVQKHLKGRLSTTGATFSRFVFAAPLACLYVLGLTLLAGFPLPHPNPTFLLYGALGGLAQIGATALLVYLFGFRNFAVGTTYSKTETVQTAIFGLVILGDPLRLTALAAILISLAGVTLISVARSQLGIARLATSLTGPPALIGIASGAGFGISAVAYRAASLSLGDQGFLIQAAFTLACVTLFQTVVMALYMQLREPGQILRVLRAWRVAVWAGASGMVASAGWFTAMTLQNAAYVRALGQIELVFTFAAAILFFREMPNRIEVFGILLVVAGILLLVLS
jgi:drug/metabolite transporter (DMT)-like permease